MTIIQTQKPEITPRDKRLISILALKKDKEGKGYEYAEEISDYYMISISEAYELIANSIKN